MRFLPKTVQQLVTTTPDAQRVRDGLTAAVQPTLNFLNTFFQSATDGSLQVTKPTTFQNAVNVAAGMTVRGRTVLRSLASDPTCLVLIPSIAGVSFYTTNTTNTTAVYQVTDVGNTVQTGSCTAQGFVSTGTGFRRSYQMGTYWSNGTMATTDTALQRPITTGSTAYAGMNAAETMAIPGSVISLTGYANGSPGGTWTMTLYKNNAVTGLTASSTTQTLRVNAQKNAFTFNNDDFLTVCIKGSSSSMQQAFSASIEVEGYA